MGTSRTPYAEVPVPYAHRPHDRLVASGRSGPRSRAHLRLVPEVNAAPARRPARPAPKPAAAGRARRPASAPAAPPRPAPIRLTRRGRAVVVLFLSAVVLVGGWFASRAVADAATTGARSAPSVVAHNGDTLWTIAVRAEPNVDPRITVHRIMDANGLATPVLQPGQRLILPRS